MAAHHSWSVGIRQALDARVGPEWSEWADAAAMFRTRVRAAGLEPPAQEACFDRFFSGTFDAERLAARVPAAAEIDEWLTPPAAEPAGPWPVRPAAPAVRATGRVSLVGAGPGCAGLLTVRGRERLFACDAVVYDRLAAGALPPSLPAHVELHAVGKESGHHPVPQDQINALLVRLAREGKRVVRLKGGDPYVFGRGGEEAEALVADGIPFDVTPGVTAGIAAPAFAGIPVTHRGEAVQVTFLTAHECHKDGGAQVRWDLLAQDPNATLVGYMGVTAIGRVVERLTAAGLSGGTPAAMIEHGGTAAQRAVISTLDRLPGAVVEAGNPGAGPVRDWKGRAACRAAELDPEAPSQRRAPRGAGIRGSPVRGARGGGRRGRRGAVPGDTGRACGAGREAADRLCRSVGCRGGDI